MLYRIEAGLFSHIDDTQGRKVAISIGEALGIVVSAVRMVKVFTLDGFTEQQAKRLLESDALHDPVLQEASLSALPSKADWVIEVGFRPGVTDNEGRTARDTAALVLGMKTPQQRQIFSVFTSVQYHLYKGDAALSFTDVQRIAKDLLANELIQRYEIKSADELLHSPFKAHAAGVVATACAEVTTIPLAEMDNNALMAFSRENTLALSLDEMRTIQAWFGRQDVQDERLQHGLSANPTDAEVEMLAQTWSEHCKHKIFASKVNYTDTVTNTTETIDSLYKTYIMNTTKTLREQRGADDFCRSVFTDNAGVVAFNDTHDVCIKVETHNSPSALDPYGGALTGIVGVNRDPLGTGLGAELLCNTDVFCFASPFHDEPLPPRLLHPRRVLEGVREGVEHGGNKSGVPTVNGSIVFEPRFLGKPLVYCGTVGLMPREVPALGGEGAPRPGYAKKARPGDIVVMVGGRIGKDGIHGATFSSEELHEGSPATAVQIGDPITQRKVVDFIIQARGQGLYSAITDNGAGGLASSVGEMAEDTGGCHIDMARAPLKYDGLRPWEILLSEAQERMTLAVPPALLDRFLALAEHMDVEATALGSFTDSGYFHVTYGETIVTHLSMAFLHKGLPQLELNAVWEAPKTQPLELKTDLDNATLLERMLGRLNICSKEYLIRQYDHEVRGGSVIKPLVGVAADGPADGGVLRPLLTSEQGIVVSHGICPKFSDYDTWHMTANAIDEAIRNAVAVGGDPDRMAGTDNFCWCDPVESERTPDGAYKMAQLVRSCQALSEYCLAFGVPCVSGKDSMKNDYTGGGVKISIPPTLLFSVLGIVPDINKAVSSDFKTAGDAIYLLGVTKAEMAGSELASELGQTGGQVPTVNAVAALASYRIIHKAMQAGLVTACHDLSDGGLAVAVAEMCLGGRLGATLDLQSIPTEGNLSELEKLYSESASRLLLSVKQEHCNAFETLFQNNATPITRIGTVEDTPKLCFINEHNDFEVQLDSLTNAFKATLNW